MNCLVTAGPTYEPLDEVRRLTNCSTGRLGCELAGYLTREGHAVTLLLGCGATYRGHIEAQSIETFSTAADLQARLRGLSSERFDALFHAAAVSDFGFGRVWKRTLEGRLEEVHARKLSTRQGALLAELIPTSKIIVGLRPWFPQAKLIGWKYEVDGDRDRAVIEGVTQIQTTHTDACVVNGPAYGRGYGLVTGPGRWIHCGDAPALFCALANLITA
jgi:phosphopantothenoylcysteine decarboxylase/phosphopantothenate--cysteine ligase